MSKTIIRVFLCVFTACATIHSVQAQPENVTTFRMPEISDAVVPTYPYRAVNNAREGFVEVNYMVDTNGKAFDPIVTYSVGDDSFQREAIRAIEESTFIPATLDGEPIVGSATRRFKFTLDAEFTPATYRFINRYNKFKQALTENSREDIRQELDRLEDIGSNNFYEDAYLNLARYEYELRFEGERKQMEYLHAALSNSNSPEDPTFFEEETIRQLRRLLLPLQINNNFFIEAMYTYVVMTEAGDTEAVEYYKSTIDAVRKLRRDDTEYAIPFSLDKNGLVFANLFKNNIYLTGGEGDLEEIRLHCQKHHVSFSAERDFSYKIPEPWGFCVMSIIGDPEASFSLVQH